MYDESGFGSWKRQEIFLFITAPTLPCIQWALGVKWLWPGTDHSLNPVLMLTREWSFISVPPSCLRGLRRGIHPLFMTNECWHKRVKMSTNVGRKTEDRPYPVTCIVAFLSCKLFVNTMLIMLWIYSYFVAQCMNIVTSNHSFLKLGICSNDIWKD